MSWQVIKLTGHQVVVLMEGLSEDLALVMCEHFKVGAMPGELIQVRLDPGRILH